MTSEAAAKESLREQCRQTRELVAEELARRGFQGVDVEGEAWRGTLTTSAGRTMVDVVLPADFPFVKPQGRPLSHEEAEAHVGRALSGYREAGWGWHREADGSLCLFEDADQVDLPWADGDALLDQIVAWLEQDAVGWETDTPALDLERYLPRSGEMLVYADLGVHVGSVLKLSRQHRVLHVGRRLQPPKGRRGARRPWPATSALVLDIGEVQTPIRGWPDLLDAAGPSRSLVEREVDQGVEHLIVLYRRGIDHGVLALEVVRPKDCAIVLRAHDAASTSAAAVSRRGHPRRGELASAKVAVVGVGAVGSVVADLLHRSGVTHLTLIDDDRVKPGNVVRHVASTNTIGAHKVEAVRRTIEAARPGTTSRVSVQPTGVRSSSVALAVLADHDVVLDATADSTASVLLAEAGKAGAGTLVSVAILADGYAVRVEHVPSPNPDALPEIELPPRQPGFLEAGCSSPVSTTPAAAVWEAAAMACRHVTHTLLGDAADCPGEQRVIVSGVPS
jgi:molybdopterin/thiamine biosynthesis adenylyltransferase